MSARHRVLGYNLPCLAGGEIDDARLRQDDLESMDAFELWLEAANVVRALSYLASRGQDYMLQTVGCLHPVTARAWLTTRAKLIQQRLLPST